MRKKIIGILVLSLFVLGSNFGLVVHANATSVSVSANPLWTDTGITLSLGSVVSITATGSWTFAPGYSCGPDGYPVGPHYDDFQHFDENDKGRLIAFIGPDPYQGHWGDANFFPQTYGYISIGSSKTFTATTNGKLWLGCNDASVTKSISDNYGSLSVVISVQVDDCISQYNEGYAAGVAACLVNPAACGINVNGGDAVTLTPDLKMHLPNLQYNTLLGIVSMWADFAYDGTKTDGVYFKMTGAGAN